MHENDGLLRSNKSTPDMVDQTSHRLAGINGIEKYRLGFREQIDCLVTCLSWRPICCAKVAIDIDEVLASQADIDIRLIAPLQSRC